MACAVCASCRNRLLCPYCKSWSHRSAAAGFGNARAKRPDAANANSSRSNRSACPDATTATGHAGPRYECAASVEAKDESSMSSRHEVKSSSTPNRVGGSVCVIAWCGIRSRHAATMAPVYAKTTVAPSLAMRTLHRRSAARLLSTVTMPAFSEGRVFPWGLSAPTKSRHPHVSDSATARRRLSERFWREPE